MVNKVKGTYTGIYIFDYISHANPDFPLAIFTSKKDEGAGTYELPYETYAALKRPKKIKVSDCVEKLE
jgi:hypothetical protein